MYCPFSFYIFSLEGEKKEVVQYISVNFTLGFYRYEYFLRIRNCRISGPGIRRIQAKYKWIHIISFYKPNFLYHDPCLLCNVSALLFIIVLYRDMCTVIYHYVKYVSTHEKMLSI